MVVSMFVFSKRCLKYLDEILIKVIHGQYYQLKVFKLRILSLQNLAEDFSKFN